MCGLVAQFSKKSLAPDKSRIMDMAADIEYRGPDDEGYYFSDWLGLGFKRLSIIDLSYNAHQPMFDEHKNFVIVFNGELYNYKSIRDELIDKGYSFFSQSDTEVVLKSYMEWGENCLSRFTGMFAFIIVNLRKDEVFAARDQLGIKPLYYFQDENYIYFASEIKCFRNCIDLQINQEALYEQFYFRYVSGARTIFKDIHRVEAGHFLRFDKRGELKHKKYYDIVDTITNGGYRDIDLHYTNQLLGESILSHTQSDVGFGVQLSGGIDSSYLVASLNSDHNQVINTYSVEFPGFEFDEADYQRYVSKKYNTNHLSIRAGFGDFIEKYEKATWHLEFPIYGGGSAPFLITLNDAAKSLSKVMLAGEGGDELFLGYNHYSYPLELKHVFNRYGIDNDLSEDPWDITDVNQYLNKDLKPAEEVYLTQYDHMRSFTAMQRDIGERYDSSSGNLSLLTEIIISDQTSYLQSRFEVQDKMGMASSVEVRVPYCIQGLFNLINSFEHKSKITPYPKRVLKQLCEQYFDHNFIHRDKVGFQIPFDSWLRDDSKMKNHLDLLSDGVFKQRGYYNVNNVSDMIDEHITGKKNNSKSLVYLINFETWHRMFIDNPKNSLN